MGWCNIYFIYLHTYLLRHESSMFAFTSLSGFTLAHIRISLTFFWCSAVNEGCFFVRMCAHMTAKCRTSDWQITTNNSWKIALEFFCAKRLPKALYYICTSTTCTTGIKRIRSMFSYLLRSLSKHCFYIYSLNRIRFSAKFNMS